MTSGSQSNKRLRRYRGPYALLTLQNRGWQGVLTPRGNALSNPYLRITPCPWGESQRVKYSLAQSLCSVVRVPIPS